MSNANNTSEQRVIGTEYRRVIRRADGRFFLAGSDCADRWVVDPLDASDFSGYMYLRDALEYVPEGAIVEIEVTARLSGYTEAHLYRDGEYVDPRALPLREA